MKNSHDDFVFAKGEELVARALRKENLSYLKDERFKHDMRAPVRHMLLAHNKGQLIVREMTNYLRTIPDSDVKKKQQHKRAANELHNWCSKKSLPPVLEVMTKRTAEEFLFTSTDAVAAGTVDNYRASLGQLWCYVFAPGGRLDA